jgi:hypothetical protein
VAPPFEIDSDNVHVSVYVDKCRLNIVGFCRTPWGAVPFSHHCLVDADVPDGPVNIELEETHPAIIAAVDGCQETLMRKAKKESVRAAIQSLVERARQGDQNAMGMIASIREEAMAGNSRARRSLEMLKGYAYEHPAAAPPNMGAEKKEPLDRRTSGLLRLLSDSVESGDAQQYQAGIRMCIPGLRQSTPALDAAGVILANGPPLLRDREGNAGISDAIEVQFGTEKRMPPRQAFRYGAKRTKQPEVVREAMTMLPKSGVDAMCVGYAVGLGKRIQAVRKGAPINLLSTDAAWELGE